jgi:hypothetical protein
LYREYETDIIGNSATLDTLRYLIYEWATHLHFHNRYKRQKVFQALGTEPPKLPSVIQIHSPRDEHESFTEEVDSGIPIACVAQYHPRQWKELTFIVPNVIDISHKDYKPNPHRNTNPQMPTVSYAPSNTNMRGWNDKSYGDVAPILKKLRMDHKITYQLIQQKPFREVMKLKHESDIGIDEISTGSYHLSGLEYLAIGVPCFANVDEQTEKVVKDLTGCLGTPFLRANKSTLERILRKMLQDKNWEELGIRSREWMDTYWAPQLLVKHYTDMYERL